MEAETIQNLQINLKRQDDILKKYNEAQMTSSTVSTISSLASPVDSGVQMLDSESELTSVMSGCDTDTVPCIETEVYPKNSEDEIQHTPEKDTLKELVGEVASNVFVDKTEAPNLVKPDTTYYNLPKYREDDSSNTKVNVDIPLDIKDDTVKNKLIQKFTQSDFVNKNVVDEKILSRSVPNNYFDRFSNELVFSKHHLDSSCKSLSDEVFEMEHPIKSNTEVDLMNVSLNSYELLDYTLENINLKPPPEHDLIDMHVSMSEEVNENLKVILDGKDAIPPTVTEEIAVIENPETKPAEEQIVFRRQRKKKSKSDTPKKRVSFHEDILNSTKIDDIHINLGFITHEPDVSLSFFQRGFVRKPDVVKGRYSWAAEGDAPFYEKNTSNRDIKSDIYVHHPRVYSSSSSSTGSASSSIDEEDSTSDDNVPKKEPTQKLPKSSCLKKTKHKKYIDTNIVQEETNLGRKKSESNLLDTNIFGSLKNILSFSTSVPLAERGVPEGQEDVTIYSSSHDISNRRKSFGNFSFKNTDFVEVEVAEVKLEPVSKVNLAKTNLKLTKSEGFYPNYPPNQDMPANIILCDSNVYEHKGISYSYEYDNFQKNFEQENKSKSSLMYQKILKEFNFFRRKAKEEPEKEAEEDFEMLSELSTPTKPAVGDNEVEEITEPDSKVTSTPKNGLSKYASSAKLDWSDTDTVSDLSETRSSRHLNSPKKKIYRNNHFSVQSPFKVPLSEYRTDNTSDFARSLPNLRPSSSKTSLINRFLKNVTQKKMLDLKSQGNCKRSRVYLGLDPKGCILDPKRNQDVDKEIEQEVMSSKQKQKIIEPVDQMMVMNLRNQVFRNKIEQLLRIFPVRSAYTTNGDSRPLLLILTNTTLYMVGSKQINVFCNHFVLPYTELNTILIGPNAQTVHFSNNDADMQCIITTGCSKITNSLIGQLEMAMRRDVNKPKLAAVKHLSMRDMVNLRRAICKQTAVDKDEEYYYYSIVNIQDFTSEEVASTPTGPNKEGPLMFRTSDKVSDRWETAYFILKAGVLYMLSSVSQRTPMRVFPLINGACQGARRLFNSLRPHTFQLVIEGKTLHLAAPDEYVASEWLQELIHAASGIYNNKEKNLAQSCSLLMTSDHVLAVREAFSCTISSLLPPRSRHEPIKGPQALSCATISDLVSFRLPSAEQSWCVLEFSCREVHEYSGDWILYFSTNAELETFISTLETLWQYLNDNEDIFPLSTIPETDPLSKKCVDIYKSLIETWPPNTVHIQFL